MPPQGVSTPRAYARFDELGTDVKVDGGAAAAALRAGDLDALCAQMVERAAVFQREQGQCSYLCRAARRRGEGGADDGLRRGSVWRVRDARRRRGRQNGAAAKLAQGVGRAPCALRGACVPRALRAWAACAGAALLFGIIFHTAANTLLRNAKECFLCSQSHTIFTAARGRAAACAPRAIALCLGTLACILLSQFAAFAQVCAGVRADTLRLHILAIPIRRKTRP